MEEEEKRQKRILKRGGDTSVLDELNYINYDQVEEKSAQVNKTY